MKAAVLEDNDWLDDAVSTIVAIAAAQFLFSADDLALEMRRPPHPNMPGQAFAAARNLGYIKSVGYQASRSKSRKNGVIRTWTRQTNSKGAAS